MEPHRKSWNEQQQALKKALARPATHAQAIELCLGQHAAIHSARMSPVAWSFEDEVWQGLSDEAARCIPAKGEHSIAWMVWHSTRIEDMTMNCLVAGTPQVADAPFPVDPVTGTGLRTWLEKMTAPVRDTGNIMTREEVFQLSEYLNLDALRAYRAEVGRRTREIICALTPEDMRRRVTRPALEALLADRSVVYDALSLLAYWETLTVAGLLLMPATRHPFMHWNEALQVKKQVRKQLAIKG